MADLSEFLRKRNVDEEVINNLIENKIDNEALVAMKDEVLKTYLPAHGDRIAAYAFAKSVVTPVQREDGDDSSTLGSRLLNRVREKATLGKRPFRSSNTSHGQRSSSGERKKTHRRVELGWMDFDVVSHDYKQVRSPNGGGTRHLTMPRELTQDGILDIGKALFFPDGVSKKGPVCDFTFSLRGPSMQDVGQASIQDMYETSKVKMLRLYVCTQKIEQEVIDGSDSDFDSLPDIQQTVSTESSFDQTSGNQPDHEDPSGTPTIVFNSAARRRRLQLRSSQQSALSRREDSAVVGGVGNVQTQLEEAVSPEITDERSSAQPVRSSSSFQAVVGSSVSSEVTAQSVGPFDQTMEESADLIDLTDSQNLLVASNASKVKGEENLKNKRFRRLSELLSGEADITINREGAATELLKLYGDQDLMFKRVRVTFSGEPGDDFGGLTKDLYTVAWKGIFEDYFIGEDSMVPYLPLHRQRKLSKNYLSIGRILSHTTAMVTEIPARLSRSTLIQIVYGPEGVGEDVLMEDFRLFLPPMERHLVKKALSKFSSLNEKERGTLTSIFSVHGLMELPRESEIEEQIRTMAEHELIHKPAPFISLMRKGIPDSHFEAFWVCLTNDSVAYIFNKQHPTPAKLMTVIQTESDLRTEEEASLHFLQQYITGLDSEELSDFLLFVTGSTAMAEKLTVSFTNLTGLSRRPIAHTCSNVLELPVTYASVQELKREFKKLFSSDYAFQMTAF